MAEHTWSLYLNLMHIGQYAYTTVHYQTQNWMKIFASSQGICVHGPGTFMHATNLNEGICRESATDSGQASHTKEEKEKGEGMDRAQSCGHGQSSNLWGKSQMLSRVSKLIFIVRHSTAPERWDFEALRAEGNSTVGKWDPPQGSMECLGFLLEIVHVSAQW